MRAGIGCVYTRVVVKLIRSSGRSGAFHKSGRWLERRTEREGGGERGAQRGWGEGETERNRGGGGGGGKSSRMSNIRRRER